MDDLAVALIFLVISLVGWAMQKVREAGKKTSTKPELTLEDIFTDASELELDTELPAHEFGFEMAEETQAEDMSEEHLARDESITDVAPTVALSAEPDEAMPSALTPATAETPQSRVLAGIPFDVKGVKQGIIMSEVLGKPKSLR